MYKIRIIKENGFDCSWATLFIGRQYKLISPLEVTKYAVKYLENNVTIDNDFILELAWKQSEEKIDDLLERIITDRSPEVMDKEYHKWLYSIMKEGYEDSSNENLFEEIENVFSLFHSPENMHEFFRKVSDAFYCPADSKHTIHELVEEFLECEKQLIIN